MIQCSKLGKYTVHLCPGEPVEEDELLGRGHEHPDQVDRQPHRTGQGRTQPATDDQCGQVVH